MSGFGATMQTRCDMFKVAASKVTGRPGRQGDNRREKDMASKYKFSLLSGSDAIGSINIGGPLEVAGADTEAEALHLYHSYGGKKTLIRNEDGAQWADE